MIFLFLWYAMFPYSQVSLHGNVKVVHLFFWHGMYMKQSGYFGVHLNMFVLQGHSRIAVLSKTTHFVVSYFSYF